MSPGERREDEAVIANHSLNRKQFLMPKDQDLHLLATEFFLVFSRFEYALKASGFNKGDGPAQPNWSMFAAAVKNWVSSTRDQKVSEAIQFILREPPKKQFIEHGNIVWKDGCLSTQSQSDALFQYIRRIRNNLFHGGKFNGHWFAPERSELLMRAGLIVLKAAVEQESSVRAAYHG